MDTVIADTHREALRQKVERAQNLLQRAASAASVHGDPVAVQLQAILYSLGTMTDIQDAIFTAQAEFQKSLKNHSEHVANVAPEIARASAKSISEELGPQLLKTALPTMQLALRFIKQRTIYWALGAMIAVVVTSNMFTYAAGLNNGRTQGEAAARTIQQAMVAGPEAAMDWAMLMANNDPVSDLAVCRKAISTDEYGRRSCSLPVWLDPPMTGHP